MTVQDPVLIEVGLGSRSRPPAGRAGRTSLPTPSIGP